MRSELEARLQADWNLATVEEYGAVLRAAGDPRGELIAIDLVLAAPHTRAMRDALGEEKTELQKAWLGEIGENVATRFGFVEEIREDHEAVLSIIDVVAPFTRSLDLWGDPHEVRELVVRMAAGPRPWLGSLLVRSFGERTEYTIENDLARKLIDATPNLRTLRVDGHLVFDDVPHTVEKLVLQGHDAIGALVTGERVMPNVKYLDFTLHPDFFIHREPPPQALRSGLVHRRAFPALETLDVSRNEPRGRVLEPNCLAGKTSIFEVLPLLPILPHVTTLRVPSLRNLTHAQQLQATLARMPQLRVLEVARSYTSLLGKPTHARAEITIPPRVTWPAGDELRDYDALLFSVGEEWVRVDLSEAYELCEKEYATMSRACQGSWDALWAVVAALGTDSEARTAQLQKSALDDIFETVTDDAYFWNELAKRFADYAEPLVTIRRLDGYERTAEDDAKPEPRTPASSERILEHERALQECWDLDRLAVYADDLLELGDQRGELISLDLRIAREPGNDDLEFKRDEIHEQIFGNEYEVRSKLGLSILDVASWSGDEHKVAQLLVGDVANYLGELELSGPVENVDADLARVLAEPRPWLRVVRVETMGATDETAIAWSTVAAAWPHLEEFELAVDEDTPMFAGFVHPNVKRLRMTALPGFARLGGPWPSVVELDIAFGRNVADLADYDDRVLTHARLPALRSIDFTRNEPARGGLDRANRYQGQRVFFEILRRLPDDLLAPLTRMRVPAPRSDADLDALQSTLDRMPALESLDIVRRYGNFPDFTLAHPTAKITIPDASPWWPADFISHSRSITIQQINVPVSSIVDAMERYYDQMAAPAQRVWRDLWSFLTAQPSRLDISASSVYTAVEAILQAHRYQFDWADKIATALHSLALAGQTITITRTD